MIEMFLNSVRLFLRGKLFKDFHLVLLRLAIGVATATTLVVLLAWFVHPWVGALVGGLAAGALMPYLFRDLKYA